MKILANKDIKKSVSCSIGYLGSLPSAGTRASYGCAISGFLCACCLFSCWQRASDMGGLLLLFQKAESRSWNRRYPRFNAYLDGDQQCPY